MGRYSARGENSLKDEMNDSASPENIIHNLGRIYSNTGLGSDNMLDKYLKDSLYVPKNLDNIKNVEETEKKNAQLRAKFGLPEKSQDQINSEKRAIDEANVSFAASRKNYSL